MSGVRAAMLAPCYFPEATGATERQVRTVAVGLLARGHDPWVLTSHRGRPASTVEEGVAVLRLPRPPEGRLRRRKFEHHLTHVPLSYGALRRRGADVAHAWHSTDALAAARWSRVTGRPSVFAYTEIADHANLMELRRRVDITARAARDCDVVVVLSRHAARALETSLGVPARVIPPAVDTQVFTCASERSEQPTIVSAAEPNDPDAGLALLLEAFRAVHHERPEARLVVDRPARPQLPADLAQPGVEVVGRPHEPAALAERYGRAWLSVALSTSASCDTAVCESLACGTPVVARDGGGPSEVVDRKRVGLLFEGKACELARALLDGLELAEDRSTAQACWARGQDFALGRAAAAYERLYGELLERRG